MFHDRLVSFLLILAAGRFAAAQGRESQFSQESLVMGKTVLRLGASKDSILPLLDLQFTVKPFCGPGSSLSPDKPDSPPDTPDKPFRPCWGAHVFDRRGTYLGRVEFDQRGSLVRATMYLLTGAPPYKEGEIGDAIISSIGSLAAEGKKCTFDAGSSTMESGTGKVEGVRRSGVVECGSRRIKIDTTVFEGKEGLIEVSEEIGCDTDYLGGCAK